MKTPIEMMLDGVEWVAKEHSGTSDGLPYATHEGVLTIGDVSLRCYQLSNGMRVFESGDVAQFFGFESVEEFERTTAELLRRFGK